MGHKVHPVIFRMGTTTTWPSRWFAGKQQYADQLRQDLEMRELLMKELKDAAVKRIDIERSRGVIRITIHSAKPGLVIGRSGTGIEDTKKKLLKKFFPMQAKTVQVHLSVQELMKPSLEAAIVAQGVASDLERRMQFRRVLKMTIERVKKSGALGVKIAVSGRLNGAEIARREWLGWGKIPLTNLRADIDYAQGRAQTMTGAIGVKVWIYRGDVFDKDRLSQYQPTTPERRERRDTRDGQGGMRRDRRDGGAPRSTFGRRPAAPASRPAPAAEAASSTQSA